jgi:hypothetical protein
MLLLVSVLKFYLKTPFSFIVLNFFGIAKVIMVFNSYQMNLINLNE